MKNKMREILDDDYGESVPPYWECQECGYEDHKKALPKDREKFYLTGKSFKCPKCHSDSLNPVGF